MRPYTEANVPEPEPEDIDAQRQLANNWQKRKHETAAAFGEADTAWHTELVKEFGKVNAGQARYEFRGMGQLGSELRRLYNIRRRAMRRWERVCGLPRNNFK